MHRAAMLVALAVVMVAALGSVLRAEGPDAASLKGKPAPDFKLQTVDGKDVQLSGQKGRVVLVDFWATWCPPCRKSLPHLQKLSEDKNLAEKGLMVWAVDSAEPKAKVEAFLKENKFTFTTPLDAQGSASKKYLVTGIPTTVVIGRDGVVKAVFVGYGGKASDDAINKAVDDALAEKMGA